MRLTTANSGQILSQNAQSNHTENEHLDKNCILLTEGTFNSMDGEVTITPKHLEKIAAVYNEKIQAIKAQGRDPVMADYQPAQLDHSTSARDTIGRLIGPLSVAEHNGKQTLFGVIRFLGEEAIDKVSDGRWTHLSVGINSLETCILDEITVTPFPACKDAILFSKGKQMNEEEKKDEKENKEEKNLSEDKDDDDKKEEKKLSDDKDEDDKKDEKKLTEDKDEDDKKEEKKLAEKEDTEHEKGETESEEIQEHKKKLSSALTSLKTKQENLRLAIKKANLSSSFARLRREAKISPAEIKKLDLVRLAKSSDETIAAVLESFEIRQPAIHTGVYGSIKAMNVTSFGDEVRNERMKQIEKECRARFSSIPKKEGDESNNDMNFSDNKVPESKEEIGQIDLWDEIVKSIKVGDEKSAKEMYRKMCNTTRMESDPAEANEIDMKHLMSEFAALESDYSEVVRLSALSSGIKI
jgi:hypothetical protein